MAVGVGRRVLRREEAEAGLRGDDAAGGGVARRGQGQPNWAETGTGV